MDLILSRPPPITHPTGSLWSHVNSMHHFFDPLLAFIFLVVYCESLSTALDKTISSLVSNIPSAPLLFSVMLYVLSLKSILK